MKMFKKINLKNAWVKNHKRMCSQIPGWSSGEDLAFSLPGPELDSWLGN